MIYNYNYIINCKTNYTMHAPFLLLGLLIASAIQINQCFRIYNAKLISRCDLKMEVKNDPFAKANREMRRASADDRSVELRKPLGLELDEDEFGNVFVKSIEKNGRADKSGQVFVGDYGISMETNRC